MFLQMLLEVSQNLIYTNLTTAQTFANGLTSAFDSDGFTLGTEGAVYANSTNYVMELESRKFKRWITDGTINSTYTSANTSGFGIVQYTGTGTAMLVLVMD